MGLARLRDRAYPHDRARDRRHRPTDHPLHVAKAAASVHNLSQRRLVPGVASGDRPIEFPAFGGEIEARVIFFTSRLHTCLSRCAKTRLVSNQRLAYCMAQSLFQSRVMIASRLRSSAVVARTPTGSRPTPKIHLGFRLGTVALIDLLERLRDIGVNHDVLNLKYGRRPAAEMLDDLAQTIVLLFLVHRLDAG
jgi:hypothetical protein